MNGDKWATRTAALLLVLFMFPAAAIAGCKTRCERAIAVCSAVGYEAPACRSATADCETCSRPRCSKKGGPCLGMPKCCRGLQCVGGACARVPRDRRK